MITDGTTKCVFFERIITCRIQTQTLPGHVGAGRNAGQWVGARQDKTTAEQVTQERHELLPKSTNKRNPIKTYGGTKRVFDERLISGLSTGKQVLFRVADMWTVAFFSHPFHAKAM